MIDDALKCQLRALVGRRVEYHGQPCQIIEVLDSERALVLQCLATSASSATIQSNQFGEANRRVHRCHTLPLFDDASELNVEILSWLNQASP